MGCKNILPESLVYSNARQLYMVERSGRGGVQIVISNYTVGIESNVTTSPKPVARVCTQSMTHDQNFTDISRMDDPLSAAEHRRR
jgi:hypothetical protein